MAVPSNSNADHVGRAGFVERVTKETQVRLHLSLDGTGCGQVETTIPFLDHMPMQLASHGLEDVGISLGQVVLD